MLSEQDLIGHVPAAVRAQAALRQASSSGSEPPPIIQPGVASDPQHPISTAPVAYARPVEKCRLVYKGDGCAFTIEFGIVDFSLTDYSASVALAEHFKFEPHDIMDMTLTYRSKDYPVTYAGGQAIFESLGVKSISFIRREPKDDKERKSGS